MSVYVFSIPGFPGFVTDKVIVPASPQISTGPLNEAVAVGSEAPAGSTITVDVLLVILQISPSQPKKAVKTGLKMDCTGHISA